MKVVRFDAVGLLLIAALVAGQALHWFLSGQAATHSFSRNLAVCLQLLLSLGGAAYVWAKL